MATSLRPARRPAEASQYALRTGPAVPGWCGYPYLGRARRRGGYAVSR
ncbi:hypothetical protein [Plantactinospora sp. DSM 117369]